MSLFKRIARSSDLASGMMNRLGADVADRLVREPDLFAGEVRSIIIRCAACSDQEGCARLQAENETLAHPPAYCLNADRLEHLRD